MVKVKYILIAVFSMYIETIFAQYYEMGERKVLNTKNSPEAYCELHLQKDKYYILFTEGTGELSSSFFVSYGRVHTIGNMYYLKDIPCNAEIVLEANNDKSEFVVKKGFSFMENERFLCKGETDDTCGYVVDLEVECKNKRERDLHNRKKKSSYPIPFRLGVYKNESITLSLDNNYLYQIHYHLGEYSPIISEGKWSKEGNLLKLYDSFLDYSFTALIDSNKITVIDFPNDVYPNKNYSPIESEMLPTIVK